MPARRHVELEASRLGRQHWSELPSAGGTEFVLEVVEGNISRVVNLDELIHPLHLSFLVGKMKILKSLCHKVFLF